MLIRRIALIAAALACTVPCVEAVESVTAGWRHTVVLEDDGSVRAWGEGEWGQLGNGEFVDVDEPVSVLGPDGAGQLSDIVSVSAGMYHTLAIREDGSVWAWGANTFGQLGDGRWGIDASSAVPVRVLGVGGEGYLQGVVAVAGGWDHSVALLEDGTVVAWGSRCHGQLGDGIRDSNDWSAHPVQVLSPSGEGALDAVTALACGAQHTLALRGDGTVVAWGGNDDGQLGRGHLGDIGRMHRLSGSLSWTPEAAGRWSLALEYTYTDASHLETTDRLPLVDEFDGPSLVASEAEADGGMLTGRFSRHADAVEMSATVSYPATVEVGEPVTLELSEILIGSHEGDNDYAREMHLLLVNLNTGQEVRLSVDDALTRSTALPAAVVGPDGESALDDVTSLAAGVYHSLALRADGSVWSWGYNGYAQLGHGTRESIATSEYMQSVVPTQMIGGAQGGEFLTEITAIAAGYETSYALDSAGRAWSCGWNVYGGLGMGVHPNDAYNRGRMQPVSTLVDGERVQIDGLTAIAAGGYHALAIDANGDTLAWGHNGFGQLGDSTRQDRFIPILAGVAAPDVEALAAHEPVVGPAPPSPAV
ncbi:MAG: RCC1 domain-containing protein, partial [Armatimonadota bacterium]